MNRWRRVQTDELTAAGCLKVWPLALRGPPGLVR